jgi:hypothetical protein
MNNYRLDVGYLFVVRYSSKYVFLFIVVLLIIEDRIRG